MAEDSTPVLRGSLNKCFVEQHDINNGSFEQWCFDQQQNDLKQLTVQYEDLEERVAVLKVENIELRNHLNLTIDTVNNIVKILNGQGRADEVATPMEEDQSPDEEGGDEMTVAMKAAEELRLK